MEVITEKQAQRFIENSGYHQYQNKLLCSCSLKEFLTFVEGTIYDDPALLIEKKSLWKLLKDSPRAIGADEAVLEKTREAERAS
jgi:hypothetical protein